MRWLPFSVRLRLAQLRVVCSRHRLVVRTLVAAAVLAASSVWLDATTDALQAKDRWGSTVVVVVGTEGLAVGEQVAAGGLVLDQRPEVMVPGDALRELPHSAVMATSLEPGEVLTERHLHTTRPRAVRLSDGDRALAVPLTISTPPLRAGDQVDLFLVLPAGMVRGSGELPGTVVSVDENAATVAVAKQDADEVAAALIDGAVVLALRSVG